MERLNKNINININRGKYLGSRNLKVYQYSTTNKSEVFFFDEEKDIFCGLGPLYKSDGSGKRGSCMDEEKKKRNQLISAFRAKSKIKKLIIENGLEVHYVTTYKDSNENRDNTLREDYRNMVLNDNKLFLKKLAYHLGHRVAYVAVPEYQIDRFKKYGFKFLHMHIALGEPVDERLFWSIWNSMKCMECDGYLTRKKGGKDFKCGMCDLFVGVISISDDNQDIFKTGNYFRKYFSKGFKESDFNQRTFNQKRYLNSHKLRMPKIYEISLSEEEFFDLLSNCEYAKSMGNNNDVGSQVIVDNKVIDKYLGGDSK